MKKQGRGYGSETPIEKADTLKALTDKCYNTVDAETPEAARDAHGIPAASNGSARIRGNSNEDRLRRIGAK